MKNIVECLKSSLNEGWQNPDLKAVETEMIHCDEIVDFTLEYWEDKEGLKFEKQRNEDIYKVGPMKFKKTTYIASFPVDDDFKAADLNRKHIEFVNDVLAEHKLGLQNANNLWGWNIAEGAYTASFISSEGFKLLTAKVYYNKNKQTQHKEMFVEIYKYKLL